MENLYVVIERQHGANFAVCMNSDRLIELSKALIHPKHDWLMISSASTDFVIEVSGVVGFRVERFPRIVLESGEKESMTVNLISWLGE